MSWPPLTLWFKILLPYSPKYIETFHSSFVPCSLRYESYSIAVCNGTLLTDHILCFLLTLLILQISVLILLSLGSLFVLSFSTISVRLVCLLYSQKMPVLTQFNLLLSIVLFMYSEPIFRVTFSILSENPHPRY